MTEFDALWRREAFMQQVADGALDFGKVARAVVVRILSNDPSVGYWRRELGMVATEPPTPRQRTDIARSAASMRAMLLSEL